MLLLNSWFLVFVYDVARAFTMAFARCGDGDVCVISNVNISVFLMIVLSCRVFKTRSFFVRLSGLNMFIVKS